MLKRLFGSRKRAAIVIVLLILSSVIVWRMFSGGEDQKAELQTVPVERGMIVSSVSASGQVLSVNVISANTKASGIVSKVYVKDGDLVKKGDKILEIALDPQGEQKQAQAWTSYLSAKNSLNSAQATLHTLQSQAFAANKKLIDDAVARELDAADPTYIQQSADWLAAEAKYKNQQSVISQAQASLNSSWLDYQLASSIITAPADGIITSLMFAPGMSIGTLDTGNVQSNQKVATVKTDGTPIVSVNLSEIDVSRVEIDKKATVILDSLPDKTFTGKVIGVDRIGQINSGVVQYQANIQLDLVSVEILPNMTVTANIAIDRKDDVLLVPAGAVKLQGGQNFVEILKDKESQFAPVEVGLTSDTQAEIVSGLSEGDSVVVGTIPSSQQGGSSPFGTSGSGSIMRMTR